MGENPEIISKDYLSLSDIASFLSGGKLFIGLTGVQNVRYLREVVKELHPKRIIECVDMDVRSNPQVQKAQSKIEAICTPLCEEYRRFTWPASLKGIDDLLLFMKLKKRTRRKDKKGDFIMPTIESFMGVNQSNTGIIGKIFYYSISNILIEKDKLIEIGNAFHLPKVKPARESKSSAYRYATTALKDRVVKKDAYGTYIYRVYCRDNKQDTEKAVCRELVKETLNSQTNSYKKLANIAFDKENEVMFADNFETDDDVDIDKYCNEAKDLYDRFRNCYNSDHVNSVIEELLCRMQAVKISIHGNLYFVPNTHLPLLNILEDYIEAVSKENLNSGNVTANSMFVADDEKQRNKMTAEFYENYRRDIEMYEERIQHFIDGGCTSNVVINRWIGKIEALQQKKATYEQVLKRQLDSLDRDFELLKMQSEELAVRNAKQQYNLPLAA